jgi:hypothetical protein
MFLKISAFTLAKELMYTIEQIKTSIYMKKQIALFAFIIILLSAVTHAQTATRKNMAKLNLSSFAFKGFNLQYERQVSRGITVAFGYGSIPKSTIAFQSSIEDAIDDPGVNVGNFQLGTSVLTPEVRFYVGKRGAFHGFYFAPYARISTYNMAVPVEINSTPRRTVLFDGKLNNATGGLLLGSNFQLSKSLYLDWWILGGSVGSGKGNLVAATALSPMEQSTLRQQLEDIDIPMTTIESEVNSNGAKIRTTGTMFGARGLGINLGIRF